MPRTSIRFLLVPLALVFVGCSTAPDDVCAAERKLAVNKLATNKLATNKIATNSLLTATLPRVPLTSTSLAQAVPPEALEDEFAQSVLQYMVSCALTPGQSVEIPIAGGVLEYRGELGLAPAWGEADGECDGECEGWISACLIARTNFKGESVAISLLGDHPGLAPTDDEADRFDVEEATYFGDLFGAKKAMYACLPDGASGPTRTCGDQPDGCAITVLGHCDDVCDDAGCRTPDGHVVPETITVNLSPEAASCE